MIPVKKIRVVFLENQLVCGGAEQALYDLISLMDQSRYDITVLAQYEDGEWESKFREAGIKVINYFVRRRPGWDPVYFVKHQLTKLRKHYMVLRDGRGMVDYFFPEGVDLVVSYSIWEGNHAGFARNAKTVKFIHGDIATNDNYRESILQIRDLLPRFDRIICVSELASQSFQRITGVTENVRMHFNPLNSDNVRTKSLQPVALPGDLPIVCAVGRLAAEKGYDRLIRIHKRILDDGIAHRLVIVGDGPEKENLLKTIQETGTENSVMLTGYQSNPYPYMKRSAFLVCSSYTEGLPVIAMEALSLGVPIVSAVPSIGEAFGGEICGLITENDDASLESGIRKMLCDENFYQQTLLGAQARSTFFDGKRMAREIEAVFEELLSQ